MSRSVSLTEVREEIRLRYDLPSFTSTTFITTTAVNSFINQSLQAYYAILLECFGDNYFAESSTITTNDGVALSSVPSRFTKLLSLHWLRGTNDAVKLFPASAFEMGLYSLGAVSWNDYAPRYRLSGAAFEWFPIPNAAYSVRCDYMGLPANLSADADFFDGGNGWEEWVVLDVCRKIAGKEEKDPSTWLAERADVEQRIRKQAPDRDEGEPLVLRDASRSGGESAYQRRNRLTSGDW
jgi:hypothetical protein